jgi:hypothetical protein
MIEPPIKNKLNGLNLAREKCDGRVVTSNTIPNDNKIV